MIKFKDIKIGDILLDDDGDGDYCLITDKDKDTIYFSWAHTLEEVEEGDFEDDEYYRKDIVDEDNKFREFVKMMPRKMNLRKIYNRIKK